MKKFDSIVPASETQKAPSGGRAEKGTGIDSVIKNAVVGAFDGINAGIGQFQDERTADRAKAEIGKQLYKLEIPEDLQKALHPRFHAWGYQLEQGVAKHPFGKPDYTYTALRCEDAEIALAHLPAGVFATEETGYAPYVSDFAKMLKAFRERRTRLFADGIQGITFAFRTAIDDERKGADWQFIPWNDVIDLQKANIEFWQAFGIVKPALASDRGKPVVEAKAFSNSLLTTNGSDNPVAPGPQTPEMKQKDIDRLVNLLARKALSAPPEVGVRGYFRNLLMSAELPSAFKEQRGDWTGDARFNAVELVNWALNKGTNPRNRNYSTLGSILMPQFADSGLEQAATLASLIVAYALCHDTRELNELAMRYQIPERPEPGGEYGPEITWRGAPEVELQGWLRPEPDLLDVGFLKRAIECATSVCRVEVGLNKLTGTGVLIDSNLVLTNFHVLGETADAVAKAAPTTKLRFGAFTARDGDEKAGQLVSLDATKPVVASSPIEIHDFVLLRVDKGVSELMDIEPAAFSVKIPGAKSGVNILQHPGGDAMKLAISGTGVTGAYPDSGYLQYVSRTAPGSSGGPCFDDDWNVVALHHAVRSRAFGTIGEGILMANIHALIKGVLRASPS